MDFTWLKAQFEVAWAAPAVVLPLMGMVAGAVWRWRGNNLSGAMQGLREQVAALKEHLALAKEGAPDLKKKIGDAQAKWEVQAADFEREMDTLKAQMRKLNEQVTSNAPRTEIESTARSLTSSIAKLDKDVLAMRIADSIRIEGIDEVKMSMARWREVLNECELGNVQLDKRTLAIRVAKSVEEKGIKDVSSPVERVQKILSDPPRHEKQ